ncbi:GNAT family N-acetyltransferase [Algoriphagus halophytocola]|uniref:GNAT family N-acetyltransferase n=1 Tax=Algoriphagus halophytocola TaxID=2991499 RepID=A0ABY6MLK6_9BACT|nr:MULTISPECIES: GNAT family N-acetyltransferase [unclassified Algoriphagus]UZD24630.1 GNAT family N-acetyltransferase [Algoriphagus sp. TR-M5]WBL41998.1 GNAT family N-acetyltransferase [Algoriphagus sp. TR-M9]
MSLQVEKITRNDQLKSAYWIREQVFVLEQGVNPLEEYDDHESESIHFLACLNEEPVGTARWRFTPNGVKLERFAVLEKARGKGVGQALVAAVLKDVSTDSQAASKIKYLHAQLSAVPLYAKFGFKKVGDIFEECNIKHYKMQLA